MKTWKMTTWGLPLLIILLCSCGGRKSTVYTEKGLVTGKPGMNVYSLKGPGESAPLTRSYQSAPPLVPHRVDDVTIDRNTNECLDCHLEGEEMGDGQSRATKIPPSHLTNEHTGEVKTGQVVGIRYYCVQCHVPQSDDDSPYFGTEK